MPAMLPAQGLSNLCPKNCCPPKDKGYPKKRGRWRRGHCWFPLAKSDAEEGYSPSWFLQIWQFHPVPLSGLQNLKSSDRQI